MIRTPGGNRPRSWRHHNGAVIDAKNRSYISGQKPDRITQCELDQHQDTTGGRFDSLLRDEKTVMEDINLIKKYLGGIFSDDELNGIVRKMGAIVAKGNETQSVAAFQALCKYMSLHLTAEKQKLFADELGRRLMPEQFDPPPIDAESKQIEAPSETEREAHEKYLARIEESYHDCDNQAKELKEQQGGDEEQDDAETE